MKQWMPLLRTWILPIAILLGLNVAFLSPAYLSGDILDQDDIKLGYAKSKEIRDYREATGEEPLWTNSMFSGMPTAQISTKYGGNIFQVHHRCGKNYWRHHLLYVHHFLFNDRRIYRTERPRCKPLAQHYRRLCLRIFRLFYHRLRGRAQCKGKYRSVHPSDDYGAVAHLRKEELESNDPHGHFRGS